MSWQNLGKKQKEKKKNRRKVEISKDTRRIDITAQQGTKKLKVRKKKQGKEGITNELGIRKTVNNQRKAKMIQPMNNQSSQGIKLNKN